MSDFKLDAPFKPTGDQPKAIENLIEGLESGLDKQTLLGVTGSGKTFTVANVVEAYNRPTLVVSHNKTLAAQLASEYKRYFPDAAIEYFTSYYDYYQPEAYVPSKDMYIEKETDINREIERLRNSATMSLLSRDDVLVVASVSCIYGLGNPEDYGKLSLFLNVGDKIDRREILENLVAMQYERNDMEIKPGVFRVRGDVIDIIPGYSQSAYRIQLDGNKVERLSYHHPVTMSNQGQDTWVRIYPARHHVTQQEKVEDAIDLIEQEMYERVEEFRKQGKLIEADRIKRRTLYDLEMLRETGFCSGIENYSRYIDGRQKGEKPYTLLDYFPDDFLMIIDESHMTLPQVKGMHHGDRARKTSLVDYGFRLPSAYDNRPLSFDEFEKYMKHVIFTTATPGPYEKKHSKQIVEQLVRPTGLIDPEITLRPIENQIDDLMSEIDVVVKRNERVLVTTLTKKTAEMLTEYLVENGVRARYLHSDIGTVERIEIIRELRLGTFDVLVGINLLREGLDLPEVSLVAILDADKEGFLRSEWALIQTMGRAARNVHGSVILYADHVSNAMRAAIDETNRRRVYQLRYNDEHGITPESIQKDITDIAQGMSSRDKDLQSKLSEFDEVELEEIQDYIIDLEEQMKEAARNLEFEKAASLRDQIIELRKKVEGK
ncbi:MAG: excinulease of nucleotide excision repair, DNA damage recognition component [Candidatus Thorarchaeota archaeon]|nr:MAG: excinulease of nucleotide excision repair, DNA damage recognition component [Candidatus Thorarchaeota archaeon]